MMKNKLITFLVVTLATTNLYAMDLNEALTQAYKNNPELKLKREEYLRSIEQYPEALSEFMPKVNAQISRSITSQKSLKGLLGDPNSDPVKGTSKETSRGLSIKQSLFNGGGSLAGLQAAKLAYLEAKSQLELNEQDILRKAIDSYLTYIQVQESYDAAAKSVKAYAKQYESTQQKYKLGESTKTEVAQAKAVFAQAKAQQASTFAKLQAQRAEFKRTIGVNPTNLKLPNPQSIAPNNFDNLLSKITTNNPNIIAAKYKIEASKSSTYKAKSILAPSVDLDLSLNKTKKRSTVKGRDGISQADPLNKNATLTLSIPILAKGGAEYSAIRKQKSAARSAALGLEQVLDQLTASAVQTWENYIATKERIALIKDSLDSANLALEGVKQEEALGTKTVVDVLNAQNEVYKAQIGTIEAKKDHLSAIFDIQYLMGTLTAQSMKLKVDQFNAEQEFNKIKHKIIGY
jgi:outer membrane protein